MTLRALLLLFLALMGGPATALSQEEILTGAILPGYPHEAGQMAGLSLTLAPGWKTYWRAPGEAGIPPSFDWSGSENVKSVRIHWPTPSVFDTSGIETIGYHDGVVLPLEVTPRDPAQPMRLVLGVDLGICKNICMPARLDLSADLSQSAGAAQIRAALKSRPARAGTARCRIEPVKGGLALTAEIDLPRLGPDERVAVEVSDPALWPDRADVSREGGRLIARSLLYASGAGPSGFDRSGVTLTVLSGGRAAEIRGCPAP